MYNSSETPGVMPSTDASGQVPSPMASSIPVSSPKDGEEYCYGESVPIRFSAPKGADYITVNLVSPTTATTIAQITGVKDQDSPVIQYSYDWDGTYGKDNALDKQFVQEGRLYQIYLNVSKRDAMPEFGASTGRFSFIDCHIPGAKPPVR